jgi:hypothetical protein
LKIKFWLFKNISLREYNGTATKEKKSKRQKKEEKEN